MKKQLKRIRSYIREIDELFITFFAKNHFLAGFYYFLKTDFWRENKAVLYGRYQYRKNTKQSNGNYFLLRRSIHRIEKGILMRPRRDVFAASYIEETVDNYLALRKNGYDNTSIIWGHDVLNNYFEVVDASKNRNVKNAKDNFYKFHNENINVKSRLVPYKRNLAEKLNISLDEFTNLAKFRRSVRWFLEKNVEHSKIDEAIKIAAYSPSACNRLPYKFLIFDEKEKVNEIAKAAMGTVGYLENIPTIVAVVGDLSAYPSERDRHLIYIDSALASMSLVYGLEVQELSSCIINWPDIEKREKRISKILSLKPYERVTMLIAIGYADPEGMVAYSQKKDLVEIRSYN